MFFTLAVSAPDPATCAALAERACGADARVMPIPGPARVTWRAAGGRAALITWGQDAAPPAPPTRSGSSGPPMPYQPPAPYQSSASHHPPASYWRQASRERAASYAGTIWGADEAAGTVFARTGLARVDPVFLARAGRATVLSDRATWAAAVSGRLGDTDALLYAGLLGPGYPLGAVTPFAGVRALGPAASCRVADGVVTETGRAALSGPALAGPTPRPRSPALSCRRSARCGRRPRRSS